MSIGEGKMFRIYNHGRATVCMEFIQQNLFFILTLCLLVYTLGILVQRRWLEIYKHVRVTEDFSSYTQYIHISYIGDSYKDTNISTFC